MGKPGPGTRGEDAGPGPGEAVPDAAAPCGDDPVVVLDARVVTGSGGGPDKTILNSPRFLEGTGYRMLCAYMHAPGDPGFESLRRRAQAWGAPLLSIPDRGPWDWRVVRAMLAICRRERVAIWHGHDYKSNALGLLLRPHWPMRLVTTLHGWVQQTRRTPLYYAIDRFCLARYERLISVSDDLYEWSLSQGIPRERCVLIENGVDTQQFSRSAGPAEAKGRLGIPADRLVIGAVGRLSGEKGFDVLIRSVDRLLGDGFDVELLIAGEGDDRPRLEELVAGSGRRERIRLLGFQAETRPLYEAMDVFALSSHREGLPNVLLEAMAMDVPIVATRIAGIPRLVRDEETGLLVEPGSVAELAGALNRLLGDPELRERLRRAGRATVEGSFSFEVRMRKIRALYDDLLGRGGPATPSPPAAP